MKNLEKIRHWFGTHKYKWGEPYEVKVVQAWSGIPIGDPFYQSYQMGTCEICGKACKREV